MNNKKNYVILKWIISFVLSIRIGTLAMNILGNVDINIWITRVIGAIITAIIGLLFYQLWIKKEQNWDL